MLDRWRSRGLRLGVVSNAWPSLERDYRARSLPDYFDPFVISAQVGCSKPDARIFQVALDRLGLPPHDVLLVDDSPRNVATARALGMQGVALARADPAVSGDLPVATSLTEVDALLL